MTNLVKGQLSISRPHRVCGQEVITLEIQVPDSKPIHVQMAYADYIKTVTCCDVVPCLIKKGYSD